MTLVEKSDLKAQCVFWICAFFVLLSAVVWTSPAAAQGLATSQSVLPVLAPTPRFSPTVGTKVFRILQERQAILPVRLGAIPRFRPNLKTQTELVQNTGSVGATAVVLATPRKISPTLINPFKRTPDVKSVSLDIMIGQMLMMGFQGDDAGDSWPKLLAKQIEKGQIGGVLFLRHNVASASGVKGMTRMFQNAGGYLPPFISVDQEGGQVERLGRKVGFREIPSARHIALKTDASTARKTYADLARRLKAWGFNTNYGPVADIIANPSNPIIAKKSRAFSSKSDIASKFGLAFVEGHRSAGLVTAVKHFPGHGSSRRDSHLGFTDISKTWKAEELKPFRTLIQKGAADMVMDGHLYLRDYAPRERKAIPASLSKPLVDGLLRRQLGYQGVVITDDLDMGAIRKHFTQNETILRAIRAGVDVLILSNSAKPDRNLPGKVIAMVKAEAQRDPALRRNIEASYRRIVQLKHRLARNS